MMTLNLSLAVHNNDHHRRALTTPWPVAGCQITTVPLAAGEMYSRVFDAGDIDAAEMSIARYARLCSEARSRLVAVPYYFARVFPHRYFYVRTDFGSDSPADLKGCRIGLSEYDHTGHTWARALLQDEYGVPPSSVRWICARREEERPPVKHDFTPPPDVSLTYAPPEKTLSRMLLDGEIDAILNPNTPSCFTLYPDKVRRLIPDIHAAELGYFSKTGICPIQHVLGLRRDLAEAHPWLPGALVSGLEAVVGTSRDIWPAGAAGDVPSVSLSGLARDERASLETFLRHHHTQGMSSRQLSIAEFFGTAAAPV